MAAKFNSPPGWPTPPEGWTPPPGWAPDPTWPQAPAGWQFWTDDVIPNGPAGPPPFDPNATQSIGTQPTQVLPTAGGPGSYAYAPSTGLEQPGASPYGTPGQAPGGYPGAQPPPGTYAAAGGPPPKQRNTGAIIAICVVAALVLGGLIWGLTSLLSGDDDPDPTVAPTTTADATETDEPTDPAATDDPTDAETDEPTDPATDDPGAGDAGVIDLTGDQPAIAVSTTTQDPIAELRLAEIVPSWEPASSGVFCGEPENGQHLGLRFDITTLPALADEEPPTYNFLGWEIGAEIDGATLEDANGFATGLFCLEEDERAPVDMEPEQSYSGWVLLDVPTSVTAVTFNNIFDFTGESDSYRWVLADQ